MVLHQAMVPLHIGHKIEGNALALSRIERPVDELRDEVGRILLLFHALHNFRGVPTVPVPWIVTIGCNQELSRIEKSWNAFAGLLVTDLLADSLVRGDVRAFTSMTPSGIPFTKSTRSMRIVDASLAHRVLARHLEKCLPASRPNR